MNETEVRAFEEQLVALIAAGDEAHVRSFVDQHFPRLPDDTQLDIAAGLLVQSVEEAAREAEAIVETDAKAYDAAEKLLKVEDVLTSESEEPQ